MTGTRVVVEAGVVESVDIEESSPPPLPRGSKVEAEESCPLPAPSVPFEDVDPVLSNEAEKSWVTVLPKPWPV